MGTAQFLKRCILFCHILLLLFVLVSSDVNFKVFDDLSNCTIVNANEQVGGVGFGSDSVAQVKEDHLEDLNGVVEKDVIRSNISESLKSKGQDELKVKDDESGNNIGGLGETYGSISEAKKDVNEGSNGSSIGMEKETSRDDECDPSNMCVDQKKNITACLRVPGNDSPDLSLLIQNKGSGPVTVTITAPEYVQLEETKVQLRQKEAKQVKVTVVYEALDNLIILTTGDSRCTLDFKELIPRDYRIEARYIFKFRYFSNLTRTHCIIFLTLFAFLVFGSVWMCSGMCKKLYQGNSYRIINTELPITGVSTKSAEGNDSWDDSWDDKWDDEEAPKTPLLPVTPSLSSRGLASRRLSKEGWKD